MTVASLSALESVAAETSPYTPHLPVHIVGDENFTSENGVTRGSGSPSDPFVIEGWEIDASYRDGIEIGDTTVSFVIQHIYIHSSSPFYRGVDLESSQGGRVSDSVISGTWCGVCTRFSSVSITRNVILGARYGVYSNSTGDVSIVNNSISGFIYGIMAEQTDSIAITDNTLADGVEGISLEEIDDATIVANSVSTNEYGINLEESRNASVRGNVLSVKIGTGIYLMSDSASIMSGNNVSNMGYGIFLGDSNGTAISKNYVVSNQAGLYVFESSYIAVTNNTLMRNDWGIVLNASSPVSVYHNDFVSNTVQSFDNRIAFNHWDNGYPSGGNYWSDYNGVDQYSGFHQDQPGPDGIGDSGYYVSQAANDDYPLMTRHGLANPPVAAFSLSPTGGSTLTGFTADASSSSDAETATGDLEVRWDWEGDGVWDTNWSIQKSAQHHYSTDGVRRIRLQVRDADGLMGLATREVTIRETDGWNNPLWWLILAIALDAAVIATTIAIVIWRRRRRRQASVSESSQKIE